MFCNVNTKKAKINISKENVKKNDYALPIFSFHIPILKYQFLNGMIKKIHQRSFLPIIL